MMQVNRFGELPTVLPARRGLIAGETGPSTAFIGGPGRTEGALAPVALRNLLILVGVAPETRRTSAPGTLEFHDP
jgi:hypothetical protein